MRLVIIAMMKMMQVMSEPTFGSGIDGEQAGGQAGGGVSLSGNGNVVALGAVGMMTMENLV